MEYHGRPVKASRLFAGNEHEQQTKKLAAHFNKPADYYKKVVYNPDFICIQQTDVSNKDDQSLLKQSAFGSRDLATFKTYEEAYHCLIADIMEQQRVSTGLAIQDTAVKRIFVDGGFSKNPIYMNLLAKAFPHFEVYAASVAQATAIGAALSIHKYWNPKALPADMIELKYYAVAQNIEA
jgi:hypothetical protein